MLNCPKSYVNLARKTWTLYIQIIFRIFFPEAKMVKINLGPNSAGRAVKMFYIPFQLKILFFLYERSA